MAFKDECFLTGEFITLYSAFLFLFFSGEFVKVKEVILDLPETKGIQLVASQNGQLYCAIYWDSAIYQLGSDGKVIRKIARKGQGPGEVNKPTHLFLMENEKSLLCIDSSSRWTLFNAETGKYRKIISKYLPAMKWEKIDQDHLLGIHNPSEKFFVKVNLNGKVVESWGKKPPPEDSDLVWSRSYATAVTESDKVFYQEGTHPVVEIYSKNSSGLEEKQLKLPKHYRDPPEKPFNVRKSGMDFKKLKTYSESFTQVRGFKILDNEHLLVEWLIGTPYEKSLDLIDLKTWKPIISNFVLPDEAMVSVAGKYLYITERREFDDMETPEQIVVHVYQLEL